MSGFLSGLKNKVMSATGADDAVASMLKKLLESQGGQVGLEHLMQQFDKAGLGEKARSWTGDGPKQPLTTEEIQRVLTSDQVKFLASCTGLPIAPLLPVIARLLPVVIEKMARKDETANQAVAETMEEAKHPDEAKA